jgi:putative tryptophan/tyrosine transport system substrate-binding protein
MTLARVALFVAFCLGLAGAWLAEAQPVNSLPRIGILPFGSPSNPHDLSLVEAFRSGLREAGVVENRDAVLDVAWTGSEPEIGTAVSGLVQRGAKLLVPFGTSASLATKRHTTTIPILFVSVGNPVGVGLVESLSRPGGNVTGFSDILLDLSGKYVQFARELGKPEAMIHYLWHNAWGDGQNRFNATERAAQAVGAKLRAYGIGDMAELNEALSAMKRAGAAIVIVQPSPFTYRYRERLVDAAMKQGLATLFAFPPAGRAGALIAYGPDYADLCRRAAIYAERILLKGMKPAELAVQEPTKFDLIVNLKTAKALRIAVPRSLLVQATETIE